jgi:hypothetical protein
LAIGLSVICRNTLRGNVTVALDRVSTVCGRGPATGGLIEPQNAAALESRQIGMCFLNVIFAARTRT